MRKLLYAIIFVVASSCSTSHSEQVVSIDTTKGDSYYIEDVSNDIKVVVLDTDSVVMGDIFYAKSYDEYNFFYSASQMEIYLFDSDFKYLSTLSKIGRGPGEYISLQNFGYNTHKRELTIYDAALRCFISYSVPDFNYVNSLEQKSSFMDLEYISATKLFTISDDTSNNENNCSINIINYSNGENLFKNPINVFSAVMSEGGVISRTENKSVLYAQAGAVNRILEIGDSGVVDTVATIDFGRKNLPEKFWDIDWGDGNSALKVINYIAENDIAAGIRFFNKRTKENILSFAFTKLDKKTQQPKACMVVVDEEGNSKVINELKINNLDNVSLAPVGLVGNYHIALIDAEQIDAKSSESKISQEIQSLALKHPNSQIAVLYKLNSY